jgi:hypothetical protein
MKCGIYYVSDTYMRYIYIYIYTIYIYMSVFVCVCVIHVDITQHAPKGIVAGSSPGSWYKNRGVGPSKNVQ